MLTITIFQTRPGLVYSSLLFMKPIEVLTDWHIVSPVKAAVEVEELLRSFIIVVQLWSKNTHSYNYDAKNIGSHILSKNFTSIPVSIANAYFIEATTGAAGGASAFK